jgi:hypothetical protein
MSESRSVQNTGPWLQMPSDFMSDQQEIASDRPALNVAGIKEHALRCSESFRAGKFKRVGQDFIDEVFVDFDCLLREIRNKAANNMVHPALEPNVCIVKGPFMDKIALELDRAICRMIQSKVQRQPTVGCTLGRTR